MAVPPCSRGGVVVGSPPRRKIRRGPLLGHAHGRPLLSGTCGATGRGGSRGGRRELHHQQQLPEEDPPIPVPLKNWAGSAATTAWPTPRGDHDPHTHEGRTVKEGSRCEEERSAASRRPVSAATLNAPSAAQQKQTEEIADGWRSSCTTGPVWECHAPNPWFFLSSHWSGAPASRRALPFAPACLLACLPACLDCYHQVRGTPLQKEIANFQGKSL